MKTRVSALPPEVLIVLLALINDWNRAWSSDRRVWDLLPMIGITPGKSYGYVFVSCDILWLMV